MTQETYQSLRADILDWVEARIKPKRFQHTLGVEDTAVQLARIYGVNPYEASIAALLHDNAKNLTNEELYRICQTYYPQYNLTQEYSSVFHAFAGAITAKRRYSELSNDVINAICFHTTGRPNMSTLEKIIYAADYAEPGREPFPGLELIREYLFNDLDDGIRHMLQQTVDYVKMKKKKIHPLTITTLDYYTYEVSNL